jgi:hypothetical protein
MSRSRKLDDDYDDLDRFLDRIVDRPIKRRRRRKQKTRQYLDDLAERRWLRNHLDDWDLDNIH